MSLEQWARLAANAPLANFETYLRTVGFNFDEPFGDKGAVYSTQEGRHVLLPTDKSIADYEIRLITLVDQLANILQLDRERVAKAISAIGFDVLRVKTGIGASSFSVDLDDAVDTLQNGYSLIDYSAVMADARRPISYIQGRRTKKVAEYLDSVRMGQTEPGSFVLTLLLPTTNDVDLVDGSETAIAFGKKVSETLASGLEHSHDLLNASPATPPRITANFAIALAEIVRTSPHLEIGVEQRSVSLFQPLVFRREDEDRLRQIADHLAPRVEVKRRTITGTAVNLGEDRAQKSGFVVIETKIEGELKNVKVPYHRSDRKAVIRAYDEKAEVSLRVSGTLVRGASGRYSMENASDFGVLMRGTLRRLN